MTIAATVYVNVSVSKTLSTAVSITVAVSVSEVLLLNKCVDWEKLHCMCDETYSKTKRTAPLLCKGCVSGCVHWLMSVYKRRLHKSIYAFGNLELNYTNSNTNTNSCLRRWVFPHFDGFVGSSFDPEQRWSAIETLMTTHCFVKRKMFCELSSGPANFGLARLAWMPPCVRVFTDRRRQRTMREELAFNATHFRPCPCSKYDFNMPYSKLHIYSLFYCPVLVPPRFPLLDALQICAVNCNRKVN